MAVKGVFASDQNISGTRKGDFASAILQVHPTGSAPLLALTSGMESMGAVDTVVTWFEENHLSGTIQVTDDNTSSDTTVTVADASEVVVGQVYLVQSTGEYVFVDAVSGTTVTLTRGFGGSSASAINGNSTPVDLQRIGTAYEEGSSKPTAVANLGYPRFNYMQIFRNAWDATGTARAVEYLTGDIVAKNRSDAAMFHAEDIEKSIIWGIKAIGALNGKPFRSMDGILQQITTNSSSQSTNTKWEDIDTFLQSVFERNIKGKPNERIAFCGNTVLRVLNQIAALDGTMDLKPGETEFGLNVNKWITPFGNISLMTHPLMNENSVWTKELYVLHPGAIRTRYLRRTHEDTNDRDGTRAGADADFGVFTTEMTVEYRAERTGGKYTGIDTAAT